MFILHAFIYVELDWHFNSVGFWRRLKVEQKFIAATFSKVTETIKQLIKR
jgi:hypothetical protein